MLIAPPIHLSPRLRAHPSRWEMALRYISATMATLLAIAGARSVMPLPFILMMVALTLTGVPVSLWLRLHEMRVGNLLLPRPLLNSLTVLCSFGAAVYFVFLPMRELFEPLLSGSVSSGFWIRFGGGEPIQALMEMFLLFAAFRSFAIISDKDATLTTVPSFSVLLLLIPLLRSLEVVLYFVAWFFVAATLFALDHRSEVREGVAATVPATIAGQDVRLGARSLATILGISLAAAVAISAFITSRNPEDRSSTETTVTALATRLTNLALSIPEVSSNSGPERQIDFKNGPNLPSRAPLWRVDAFGNDRSMVHPSYWRMFTLPNYNGVSWMPSPTKATRVRLSMLKLQRPPQRQYDRGYGFGFGMAMSPPRQLPGFAIERSSPVAARQFKKSGVMVRQLISSLVPNIGYLPVLPGVRSLIMDDSDQKEIRVRDDSSIDIGVVPIGQNLRVSSNVPPLPEYGVAGLPVPAKRLSAAQIAASGLRLAPADRALNLRLPAALPVRLRSLAASMLSRVPRDASNYAKANRIALAIQQNATYTLHPPTIPDGHDAADYFLFEGGRRGYCTYFAGALTVLCRTQGIPARVVSGFGGITWDGPDAGLLREGNAHAWTEVWMDGYGWTVVDATPDGDRGDNAPTWIESWADWTTTHVGAFLDWAGARQGWLEGLALLGLGCWGAARGRGRRVWNWTRKSGSQDDLERRAVTQTYARTARSLSRRFRPKTAWETPTSGCRVAPRGFHRRMPNRCAASPRSTFPPATGRAQCPPEAGASPAKSPHPWAGSGSKPVKNQL